MKHAVIMAGGAGTRLWPLSRRNRPKQLLRLFGGKSLLRQAYERLAAFLRPEAINVITAGAHLPLVAEELPELPAANLIGEPEGRDTANAVALSAAVLHRRDPEGLMGVFTADHIIRPVERFAAAVERAYMIAEAYPKSLVTLGVTVRGPETAFGYVKRSSFVGDGVYRVERFAEKPDVETAQRYAASPDYYWNSGSFVWRIATILDELKRNLPASYEGVMEIAGAWDDPVRRDDRLAAVYPKLQKISIDYAVMEKAREVMVVELDCQWADVGSWSQLENVLESDEQGVLAVAVRSLDLDSRNVTVVTEDAGHLIATIGVDDLIVVHSPNATLVCRKKDAQRLKELLERVAAEHGDSYL